MKTRTLTKEGLYDSMEEYASQKDLRLTPQLYVDTLYMLLRNSYGYQISDKNVFYQFLSEIDKDPNSEFLIDESRYNDGRPKILFKKGFEPKKDVRAGN